MSKRPSKEWVWREGDWNVRHDSEGVSQKQPRRHDSNKAAVVSADQGSLPACPPPHPHKSLTHHFFHLVINISTINFILVWERGEQLVCGWFWSSPALSSSPPGDRLTLIICTLCIICVYSDHSDAHPFSQFKGLKLHFWLFIYPTFDSVVTFVSYLLPTATTDCTFICGTSR